MCEYSLSVLSSAVANNQLSFAIQSCQDTKHADKILKS